MSGVLTSLVRRATGQATGGLRPRMASRFEAQAEPGFSEVHEEVAAQVSVPPPSLPENVDRSPGTEAERVETPDAPKRSPERLAASEASKQAEPPAQADRPDAPRPPEPPAAAPPVFEPLLERIETTVVSDPTEVAETSRPETQHQSEQPSALDPLSQSPEAPPDPLLPAMPQPDLPAQLTEAPMRDVAPETPKPDTSEPEITIHIGHLDIRAPQPPAPAPPRQAPARPLPSLSDYLRGGGS